MSSFFVSYLSTIAGFASNIYLVRMFLSHMKADEFSAWFSFFNLSSNLGLFIAHFLVFSITTKCKTFDIDQMLTVFFNRGKFVVFVFFFLNLVIWKCLIKYDVEIVFLFLFSLFYSFFWVLNALCSTLNKLIYFFFSAILVSFSLAVFSWLFSRCGEIETNEVLLIYFISYLIACFILLKLVFPKKNVFLFVSYFFCKKTIKMPFNTISLQNLIFDVLWLAISIEVFYAGYFFNDTTTVVAFCLFWRFTEAGKCMLERVVDSQQGVIVNAFYQGTCLFKLLLKKIKTCFCLAVLGSFIYIICGNFLLKTLFDYDKNNIPIWAWYGGALFYLQYSFSYTITHFMFFLNYIGVISKILLVNVIFFLIGLFLIKATSPFVIPFLFLINVIFIPFYWIKAKRYLEKLGGCSEQVI